MLMACKARESAKLEGEANRDVATSNVTMKVSTFSRNSYSISFLTQLQTGLHNQYQFTLKGERQE